MRDFPIKFLATRDEISWEDPGPKEARRETWQREFNNNEIANFYITHFMRNYKNSGWQDDIVIELGNIGKVTLSTRNAYTKGLWKDSDLGDTWEYLVEDDDTDTQEAIEAELRRQLVKAKEEFDTLLEAADKALADFDKAQEQDAKEVAAVHLCDAMEDILDMFDHDDVKQFYEVRGDGTQYRSTLKRATDAVKTFRAS